MKPIIVTYSNESFIWLLRYPPPVKGVYNIPNLITGEYKFVFWNEIKLIARPKRINAFIK